MNFKPLIMIIASLLVANFTSNPAEAENSRNYPYKVVTTVGMVNDLVINIAGDKADVSNIIGPGIDPHLYNPTRQDVSKMLKSDIIFYSGLLLEGKMTDVFIKVSRKKPVYAVTELIEESYLIEDPETAHSDPHVWMDVAGWTKAAEAIVNALSEFDPANTQVYQKNGKALVEKLSALDQYAKEKIASIPENKRIMITAHDAFSYLGRAYGIEVYGIQGISTESEAGVQDINRLVEMLVKREIPAIFVESTVADRNIKALIEGAKAQGHEVKIGGELFSDAMGPSGTYEGTYIGMIDHNITVITNSLGGKAPEKGLNDKLTHWLKHK